MNTKTIETAAKTIANEILSVLNYDSINISPELKIRSYRRWLSSMYVNLQQTKDIADNALNYKITVEDTVTGVPITSQQSLPINSPALKLSAAVTFSVQSFVDSKNLAKRFVKVFGEISKIF